MVQANNDNETAFIVDVTQSGIFLIDNIEEDRLPYILGAYCPNILFPFLREAVNDLVTKGSFPQLLLTPINFDAEFEANMQRAQAAAVEGQAIYSLPKLKKPRNSRFFYESNLDLTVK